jgi:flagellin-like hook-associated protein FlgL
VTDLQDVIEAVDGTEVVLNVRDNSQPSIVGVTQAYMAPFSNDIPRYGLGMSKDQYFAGTHTLAADDKGVTMDGLWTVKWSDVYSENASSLKLSFGRSISAGGMVLEFALDNGSTLEDIISELDGYTFNTNPTGRIVSVTGTAAEHYEDTGGKITGCWQEVPEDYLNGSSDIWEKVQILPSEVFEGLGYTTDKVYLTRGFYGDVYFDLQDLSNSYVRFESEGNTVEYTLSDKGKDELRQLMNDGELLPRAEYEVEFEDNNGNLLTYVMRAWTGISFDKMMNYINDSDKDLFYRLAFSEYSIDIDPTDFSTRGDTGKSYSYSETGFFDSYTETKITHRDSKRNGLWIQSTNEANKGIFVPLVNATAGGIGVKKVDVSSYEGALKAIDLSGNAIDKVSGYRSMFGAYQNRMEHAYNINKNTEENTQAAESRIRDTDMAKEMVDYSANNILVQAGNAFLTQAMQNPQGVLQLLQ